MLYAVLTGALPFPVRSDPALARALAALRGSADGSLRVMIVRLAGLMASALSGLGGRPIATAEPQ